ncbi:MULTISPECIES: hypothetical protein [Bhargavaea]|uniref:Yip1 domain-containing protein n=1 Tax=Bhargavaea changchunensis TaxID=2134037 RepID=A0ABW2NM38_9BACL|nr:hypothetical protein [Bhargavaea sp. CC-171006]
MFIEFKFWRFLLNQRKLTDRMDVFVMKGFRWRIAGLFISAAVLYALMDMWGLGSRGLTPIAVSGAEETFALRRILSLAAAVLWSVIYTAFHVYVVSFILHKLTNAGYRKLIVLQLFVAAILLLEKAVVFAIFLASGAATPVSPLSFGPLASTFLTHPVLIYFLNQLSLGTALVVAYQFRFIRQLLPEAGRSLLWIIIGLQVLMALAVSLFGMIPAESLFTELFGGGGSVE